MDHPTPTEHWRVTLRLEECYISDAAERLLAAVVDGAGSDPVSCRMLALQLFETVDSEADAALIRFGLHRELRHAIFTLAYERVDRTTRGGTQTGSISITASLRRVLARSVNNGSISTGGLLIGLLAEDRTRLARLCAVLGLTAESVSAFLTRPGSMRR